MKRLPRILLLEVAILSLLLAFCSAPIPVKAPLLPLIDSTLESANTTTNTPLPSGTPSPNPTDKIIPGTEIIKLDPSKTPTIEPSGTPKSLIITASPTACVDGMKFVSDVSYPDNLMHTPPFIKPGTEFIKIWRVQNSGTCDWTSKYRMVYSNGNIDGAQMNGQPVSVPNLVTPGQTIDLIAKLIAPLKEFTYQGFWQMENADRKRFGQSIWVGITTLSDFYSSTPGIQPASGINCQVTQTNPTAPIKVRQAFDGIWVVKNISSSNWASGSYGYKYVSGAKMHEKAIYDLAFSINHGKSGKIKVDMIAPNTPGTYNTQWAIVSGGKTICSLYMRVIVIPK